MMAKKLMPDASASMVESIKEASSDTESVISVTAALPAMRMHAVATEAVVARRSRRSRRSGSTPLDRVQFASGRSALM